MFMAEPAGKHLYVIVRYVSVVFFGIKCSVTLSVTFFFQTSRFKGALCSSSSLFPHGAVQDFAGPGRYMAAV